MSKRLHKQSIAWSLVHTIDLLWRENLHWQIAFNATYFMGRSNACLLPTLIHTREEHYWLWRILSLALSMPCSVIHSVVKKDVIGGLWSLHNQKRAWKAYFYTKMMSKQILQFLVIYTGLPSSWRLFYLSRTLHFPAATSLHFSTRKSFSCIFSWPF